MRYSEKFSNVRWRRVALVLALIMVVGTLASLYTYRHQAYRQIVLQRVADQVPQRGSDEQRALALFDEILRIGSLDPGGAVIDDDPAGTLIRGWGYCDSIAMAFVQVAERLGYQGQLVFLQDPETGTSPHTVATLKLDGQWRVFDVLYRAVSRDAEGELATTGDIAGARAPVTSPRVEPTWFENPAIFYQTRPADTMRQQGRQAVQAVVSLLPAWVMRVAQDVYLQTDPPAYVETDGDVWEDWQEASDLDYWKARNYDVFGRSKLARSMYSELIENAPGSRHAAPARTFFRQATDPASVPAHTVHAPGTAEG